MSTEIKTKLYSSKVTYWARRVVSISGPVEVPLAGESGSDLMLVYLYDTGATVYYPWGGRGNPSIGDVDVVPHTGGAHRVRRLSAEDFDAEFEPLPEESL